MSASDMLGGLPSLLDRLRKAILKRGLPARVYCDNGAIYGSRQCGRIMAEVASIVDDLVGRPVAELDPALAFHLLDGRTLTIEGAPVYSASGPWSSGRRRSSGWN